MYWNDEERRNDNMKLALNSNIRCIEILKGGSNDKRRNSWIVTLDVLKWGLYRSTQRGTRVE